MKVGICGCGNMAEAFVSNWLNFEVYVYDSDASKAQQLANKYAVSAVKSNLELAKTCQYIVLAVKPAHFTQAISQMKGGLTPNTVLVSIMAGVEIEAITSLAGCKVVRCMPNLAVKVGASAIGIDFNGIADTEREVVFSLFNGLGVLVEVCESNMNAVTAVSGSGIAYAYKFINALIEGGVECGLSLETAKAFAVNTCLAGAKMVESCNTSGMPISSMVEAVCSKGGTTIVAVEELDRLGFEQAVKSAVCVANNRAKELGK